MFEFITEAIARAHCADSEYVCYDNSYVGVEGAANKAGGLTVLTSTDITVASGTMLIKGIVQNDFASAFYEDHATYIAVSDTGGSGAGEGGLYVRLSSGVTKLSNSVSSVDTDLFDATDQTFNAALHGYHTIFCCGKYGGTPYCVYVGETTYNKLIGAGTEYAFGCVGSFKNRIFGSVDGVIYYSNLNPTLPITSGPVASTVEFPSSNQIFTPNSQRVVAFGNIGLDRFYAYTPDSILEIIYKANYQTPFTIREIKNSFGLVESNALVSAHGVHFAYDRNVGFYVFDGVNSKIISHDIDGTVKNINMAYDIDQYFRHMSGAHSEITREVAWCYSTNGASNSGVLYYNYKTGSWRKSTSGLRFIASGYTQNYKGRPRRLLAMKTNDSNLYYDGFNTSEAGASYDAYRVEPVLNFSGMKKSLLLEVWFDSVRNLSAGTLDVYYRGASTVGQLVTLSWTALGTATLASPGYLVVYPANGVNVNNRYHQIKWGTDATDDLFSIREIKFNYVPQGMY